MSAATPSRKIGAFFDIDGTLLPAPSLEWRFVSWLEACGALGFWQIARWSASTTSSLLTGELSALRRNKTYLGRLPVELVDNWEASLAPDALAAFSQGAERIAWHLQQSHRVFLISGTLAPLGEIFARRLGVGVEVQATNLEIVGGCWTGSLAGPGLSGPEKTAALIRIADRCAISLGESFAYGNEMADLAMLESVGNPIAANPRRRLRRIAAQRGWRIARWNSLLPADAAGATSLHSPSEVG